MSKVKNSEILIPVQNFELHLYLHLAEQVSTLLTFYSKIKEK